MDEIMGGKLDQSNNDLVMGIINTVAHDGTNVFVIAHGDALFDKFRGLIKFEKINGYSVMK
jgi:ABC-type lipoprotein export system ATPase subunit